MSPVPASTLAPVPLLSLSPWIRAVVVLASVLIASDPATPTLAAPAPLLLLVAKVFDSPAGTVACKVSPLAWTCALSPIRAVLVSAPMLSAKAAPMPTSAPSPTVLPSASTVEALLATPETVASPVVFCRALEPIEACVWLLRLTIATAAATSTLPPDVEPSTL